MRYTLRMRITALFDRAFPMPGPLVPHAAGIDISDSSVKWLAFERDRHGTRVRTYGTLPLPAGTVVEGIIKDHAALVHVLADMHKTSGTRFAHVSLPEEAGYVFSMHVPAGTPRNQILRIVEFDLEGRVPIPAGSAVFDYDILAEGAEGGTTEIGVSVFPQDIADEYRVALADAGITAVSLEIEARSIARAVALSDDEVSLVIDYGENRTGIAVVARGVPLFTNTVAIGGGAITRAIVEKAHMSVTEAESSKNEEGITGNARGRGIAEIASAHVSALGDQVLRVYRFWDTRRDERGEHVPPITRIVLVGGGANLKGIADYIASRVQVRAERGNVWGGAVNFDQYIPPLDRRESLRYATAVGLALRDF